MRPAAGHKFQKHKEAYYNYSIFITLCLNYTYRDL